MIRFTLFAVALFAFCGVHCKQVNKIVHVTIVENMQDYLKENPDVEILGEMDHKQLGRNGPTNQHHYSVGSRVPGDMLVSHDQSSQHWTNYRDIRFTLAYPTQGIGNIVSYVQVFVDQSSAIGRGYVISGGVGQRTISLIIEAQATYYFTYRYEIYGY